MPATRESLPRILVVEDDEALRLSYERLFTAAGYDVLAAGGVYEALRAVQRATPDVILADLMLPDGDGMGLTRALRAIASTVGVPVIAMTASARSIELLEPKSFGAECVLLKPIADDALLACIGDALAKRGKLVARPAAPVAIDAPDGTRWTVHYTRARDADGQDALLFVSRGGYRRVTAFPPDWDQLSGEELWTLSGE